MSSFLVGKSVSVHLSRQHVLLAPAKPQVFGLSAGSKKIFVGVIAFVYSFSLLR